MLRYVQVQLFISHKNGGQSLQWGIESREMEKGKKKEDDHFVGKKNEVLLLDLTKSTCDNY